MDEIGSLTRIEIRPAKGKNRHDLVLIGVGNSAETVGENLAFYTAREKAAKLAVRHSCLVLRTE